MNEIAVLIISGLFSGGAITGAVSLFKARAERKKTRAEADAIGVTTPLQADSLSVTAMNVALNSVLAANAEGENRYQLFKADMEARIERIEQEAEGTYRAMQIEMNGIRDLLAEAEDYINDLLNWIARHLPGVQPPARRRVNFTRDDPER